MSESKKEVYIDGVICGMANKADISSEIESNTVRCFGFTVVDTDPNPAVTVSIEAVRAGTVEEYINMEKAVAKAKKEAVTIQLITDEMSRDGQRIVVKEFAFNCKLTSDKVETNPTERTALKMEFTGESSKKIINEKEIN